MAELKVSVIGAGSWGTAVANVFADSGSPVRIWGRDKEQLEDIEKSHENKKYLPGIKLSAALKTEPDFEAALQADILVCSVPTQRIREVFANHCRSLEKKIILNTSKGIEQGTGNAVSEIFHSLCPKAEYAVLSGPNFAKEVVMRLPAATTIAARNPDIATQLQELVSNKYFRAYTSNDVIGVEYGGALKNVIAIATGIAAGLQLGYNAGAALINRGMAEIIRMGKHKGASPITFLGLAGTGDLFLTCSGPLSRNRSLGVALGEGHSLESVRKKLGGVAEGYYTTKSAHELSVKHSVDMPVTQQVYEILYEGKNPKDALVDLMKRDLKEEWEVQ